jgi:hypothetical protein
MAEDVPDDADVLPDEAVVGAGTVGSAVGAAVDVTNTVGPGG